MVLEYAMGTQIRSHQIPYDDLGASEALRRLRDDEVQAVAEEAYRGAHRLLSENRSLLDAIAERLLEKESIERDEILALMGRRNGHVAGPPSPDHDRRSPHDRAEALASEPPPDPA